MVCVMCMHIAVWCVWECKGNNTSKNKREYDMVRMMFKETNNKNVARRDVVLWSHKVLISSPNKSAHLVDC